MITFIFSMNHESCFRGFVISAVFIYMFYFGTIASSVKPAYMHVASTCVNYYLTTMLLTKKFFIYVANGMDWMTIFSQKDFLRWVHLVVFLTHLMITFNFRVPSSLLRREREIFLILEESAWDIFLFFSAHHFSFIPQLQIEEAFSLLNWLWIWWKTLFLL